MKATPAYTFIMFVLIAQSALSQMVTGTVKGSDGRNVAYASVFVEALHRGTTANDQGEYQLPLPAGVHQLSFQYLGLKSLTHTVSLTNETVRLDVVLQPQEYMLPEVIVTAGDEDPAYYVMRKAIGMSQYYRNQLSAYNARIYLKGSGEATKIPALLASRLKKEGIEKDKRYVTETISEITYRIDEPLETRVISLRSSFPGDSEPMQFMTLSFYNDTEGLITPLSKDAFAVYRFQLEGTFIEKEHTIFKIRVIPKRKGNDLYEGHIYIREGSWNLHSVQLQLSQKLFTARIRQQYHQVQEMVWLPVSHDYDLDISLMGVEFNYRYMVSLSNYTVSLNPKLDHAFFARLAGMDTLSGRQSAESNVIKNEAISPAVKESQQRIDALIAQNNLTNKEMRELNKLIRLEGQQKGAKPQLEIKQRSTVLDDSARLRSSEYWAAARTVPLSGNEAESFGERDSTQVKSDSARRKPQTLFAWTVFGGMPRRLTDSIKIQYDGLINFKALEYNTVDGFVYRQSARLQREKREGFGSSLLLHAAYGFAGKQWMGGVEFKQLFAPLHRGRFSLKWQVGSTHFTENKPVTPLINSINSLFFVTNTARLYEEKLLSAAVAYDPVNGLATEVALSVADRKKLKNHSDFFLTNPYGHTFSSNIPNARMDTMLLDPVRVLKADFYMQYTPMQYYRVVKGRKRPAHSAWPSFGLSWTSISSHRGDVQALTHLLQLSVKQAFDSRLLGRLEYHVTGGSTVGDPALHFADWQHFNTNSTLVGPYQGLDVFRGLGQYERSTAQAYATLHLRYEHSRILLKRLPFMGKSLIRESLFVNQLVTADGKPWLEVGYGLQQVFLLFNAEVFSGFEGGRFKSAGLRIGIPIGEATVRL